jgi:3-oxoacyl-[acyl-carrier protein] reductase
LKKGTANSIITPELSLYYQPVTVMRSAMCFTYPTGQAIPAFRLDTEEGQKVKLKDKVALVTGAGSGMGQAIAVLFAKEGAKVSVVDMDAARGQKTAGLIEQGKGQAQFVSADVAKASDVEGMIKKTVAAYGRLDILVNNAGVPMGPTPIEEVTEDLYESIMAVNIKSIYLAAKYATPIMRQQGGGIIINITSIAGVRPRPGLNVYCASKGGAIVLTKALAIELAADNIRVNSVGPVATDTPMLAKFIGEDKDYEKGRERFISTIPLGRLATPEDIAYAALYLASSEASLVTGVNLEVDGGRGI